MTFEQFLQRKHADQYTGTDDDMPEDFAEHWLYRMDQEEIIALAEEYGKELQK